MLELALWAMLGSAEPQPVRTLVRVRLTAAGAGPRATRDSWTHEVGHFTSTLLLTPAVALWLEEAGIPRHKARWLTAGTMVAVVVLKEVYDQRAVGNFSGRDLALGAAGAGLGLVLAERVTRTP